MADPKLEVKQQVEIFEEEIDLTSKEILFWLRRMKEIEIEWENSICANNNEKMDILAAESAGIYKRMQRETLSLAGFRERYNKLAKENGLKLID